MDLPRDRPAAAVPIAAVAGCVDAAGFLTLGGLFLSFMGGNLTRLGLALNDRYWETAGLAAGLIALFVGGVAAGTLIGRRLKRREGPLLALAALLVAASAWLGQRIGHPGVPTLVMAMGMLNTVYPGLGTTYLTGALVRIGAGMAGDPAARAGIGSDVAMCVALAAGVLVTARFWPLFGSALLWAPAAVLVLLAAFAFVPRRRVVRGPWDR